MTTLAARAEVIKLARALAVEPERLDFLREAPAADVRRFRERLMAELDAPHRPMFRKLAGASKLLPNALTAKIAMKYFGPMLCGMVASELEPDRAAALMHHIPVDFLADATVYVDPVAADSIVKGLDTEKMVPTMRELLRRKEYVTLARFLGAVTDEQLLAVVPLVESGEDLLMTGFYAEATDRFETVLAELPDARIRSVAQAAVDLDAFAEALTLMQHLTPPTRSRVADAAAELGPDVIGKMLQAAQREDAWAELLPVAASMKPENLHTLATLDVWDDAALTGVIRTAREQQMWPVLVDVVAVMDHARMVQIARLEILTEPEVIKGALRAFHRAAALPTLVRIGAAMPAEVLAQLATEADTLDDELRHDLLAAAKESDEGSPVAAALAGA